MADDDHGLLANCIVFVSRYDFGSAEAGFECQLTGQQGSVAPSRGGRLANPELGRWHA